MTQPTGAADGAQPVKSGNGTDAEVRAVAAAFGLSVAALDGAGADRVATLDNGMRVHLLPPATMRQMIGGMLAGRRDRLRLAAIVDGGRGMA